MRATAHPDESPPSLHVLQLYNKHSATRPMCIRVAKVPTKGLGVLARCRIRQGTAVALHRIPIGLPGGQFRAPEFPTRSHMRLTGALYESSA